MKDIWYGDEGDVVKWGVLLHLASSEGLRLIVQVAFFRREKPALETPEGEIPIPEKVWEHFRDAKSVEKRLGPAADLEVVVLDRSFENEPRTKYVAKAAKCLREMAPGKVVLLDPDTGMEPPSGANRTHVKAREAGALWDTLDPGDWMVLYQHRWRDTGWRTNAKRRFEEALKAEVKVFRGKRIASDAAFFAARKS